MNSYLGLKHSQLTEIINLYTHESPSTNIDFTIEHALQGWNFKSRLMVALFILSKIRLCLMFKLVFVDKILPLLEKLFASETVN